MIEVLAKMAEDLITTKQASIEWGISQRRISQLCNENRIHGAEKKAGSWFIPASTLKPDDARVVSGKYMNGKKVTMVSLFSGCGGLDLGFSEAGFKIVWANDFDLDAQRIYELNVGTIDKRDILTVNENEIPDCDIITAGFPCQPFSNAGNRKGIHDSRGMLYKECLRIIKKKQPKVFVFENVKGLLSTKYIDGRLLSDVIVTDLEEPSNPIELGYHVTYKLLNASDYGVPQNRQRVFFIGIRKDLNKKFVFPDATVKKKVVLGDILDIPENVQNQKDWPFSPQALEMVKNIPGIKSVIQNINLKKTNVILGLESKTLWGEDTISDYIGDFRFNISPLSFFQVNPTQTEVLYGKALEYANLTGNEEVFDAYCGTGTKKFK